MLLTTNASHLWATPAQQVSVGSEAWQRLALVAKRLSLVTLLWLGLEGGLGVWAGIAAGSIALVAFGLDSAIEALASIIVIWRFTGARTSSSTAERKAQQLVAVSYWLLAPYVAAEAVEKLVTAAAPETSWLGVALTAGTLVICPGLGLAKQRLAKRLGSGAVSGEGMQNILCAGIAAGVLVGLIANAAFGLWWIDPVVALAVAAICIREGQRTWRGDPCGCASCAMPTPITTDTCDCS